MLQHIAIVSLGGAIGATLRFAVGQLLDSTDFPWSTFMVNALGSVVLGAITVYAINRGSSEELMLFFSTGLLGAFTTMSTFSVETMKLIKHDEQFTALAYIMLTFFVCIIGAFLGWEIGERLENI